MNPSLMFAIALIALGILFLVISRRLTAEVRAKWQTKIGRRIHLLGFTKTAGSFPIGNRIGLIVLGVGFVLARNFKLTEAFANAMTNRVAGYNAAAGARSTYTYAETGYANPHAGGGGGEGHRHRV